MSYQNKTASNPYVQHVLISAIKHLDGKPGGEDVHSVSDRAAAIRLMLAKLPAKVQAMVWADRKEFWKV
jgi:hypothetical protein